VDELQQRRDVLVHIVITGGLPEFIRSLVVVPQRYGGDPFKVIG
jgi:hypothetical protein